MRAWSGVKGLVISWISIEYLRQQPTWPLVAFLPSYALVDLHLKDMCKNYSMTRIARIFALVGFLVPLHTIADPLIANCESEIQENINLYQSIRAADESDRPHIIIQQKSELQKLRAEVVKDPISQIAWTDFYVPILETMNLVLEDKEYSYDELRNYLLRDCYERVEKIRRLAREIRSNSVISLPRFTQVMPRSRAVPTLITPFGKNWVDSNGNVYLAFGNSLRDPYGKEIVRISGKYLHVDGRTFIPFGKGYVDATSGYSIRRFGNGYIDSNGNTAQPFGRGWVVR